MDVREPQPRIGTARRTLLLATSALLASGLLAPPACARDRARERLVVVLEGTPAADASVDAGGTAATALATTARLIAAVRAAGGHVVSDLSGEIGVLVVEGPAAALVSALVEFNMARRAQRELGRPHAHVPG
jgi:hypothetical protein